MGDGDAKQPSRLLTHWLAKMTITDFKFAEHLENNFNIVRINAVDCVSVLSMQQIFAQDFCFITVINTPARVIKVKIREAKHQCRSILVFGCVRVFTYDYISYYIRKKK